MKRQLTVITAYLLLPSFALAQGTVHPPSPAPAAPASSAAAAPPPAPSAVTTKPLSETLQGPAKASYDAAKLLFTDGDYKGARVKFQSAFEDSKDPRLLWNMAVCEEKLRHYSRVVNDINRYLTESGAAISDQERNDAKQLRDTIQGFTAGITLKISEPDADVLLDGEVVGKSPLAAPIVADIGERQVVVRKAGFGEFSQTIQLSGPQTIDVQLVKQTHEGRLEVTAPDGAQIKIDGQPMGIGTWSGVLPSGGHQLLVSAPHMRNYQSEVVLTDAQTRTVGVTLEAESKNGGIPMWAWVAGGVVLVGGLSVGGYFAFKKSENTAPETQGSIEPGTVSLPIMR
jgi:hypothetical protein